MKSLSLGTRIALITVLTSAVTVLILLGTAYTELLRDFERVLTQKQLIETRSLADEAQRAAHAVSSEEAENQGLYLR